jgi:hypothetical protein
MSQLKSAKEGGRSDLGGGIVRFGGVGRVYQSTSELYRLKTF